MQLKKTDLGIFNISNKYLHKLVRSKLIKSFEYSTESQRRSEDPYKHGKLLAVNY